jgi:hypothetical protein
MIIGLMTLLDIILIRIFYSINLRIIKIVIVGIMNIHIMVEAMTKMIIETIHTDIQHIIIITIAGSKTSYQNSLRSQYATAVIQQTNYKLLNVQELIDKEHHKIE